MIVGRERVEKALPGYTVGERLGSGAFGLVLAGQYQRTGHPVAIKVMEAEGSEGATLGFAAEARVLGGLNHPHVVRAFDYVEAEGLCLVVMELLAGGTLTRRRVGIGPEQVCAVGLAVAAALGHAHGRGVLHRDIKADNILFAADGTPKVGDFGIAKLFEGSAATASSRAGTPMYMAPEQIEGGRLGPATDLYALGVVLYHLLTGAPPFDSRQPLPVLWRQHLNDPPPPMVGIPASVAAVVLRALAKAPTDRYPDAGSFALDLAHAATEAYSAGWPTRARLPLHLDDHVLSATDPPAPPPRVSDSEDEKTVDSGADGGAVMPDAGGENGGPRRARRRRGQARRRVALPLTVMAVLVVVSLVLWHITDASNPGPDLDRGAVSQQLAAASTKKAAGQPDLARRLALAAYRTAPTPQARNSVLHLLAFTNRPLATLADDHARAFSPDGRLLASTSGQDFVSSPLDLGTVQLWNGTARGEVHTPLTTFSDGTDHFDTTIGPVFSPDGRLLATSGWNDTTGRIVQLWDTTARGKVHTPLATFTGHTDSFDDAVSAVAFSPDGRLLATTSNDGTARLWDTTARGKVNQSLATFTDSTVLSAVVFSPDGRLLAVSGWGGIVQLWDTTARGEVHTPLTTFTGHIGRVGAVTAVVFSPDGRLLATSGEDGTARLWDTTARGEGNAALTTFAAHTDWVSAVTFSPDGRLLATSSRDGTARLWHTIARGVVDRSLATFRFALTRVFWDGSVVFDRDGRLLATSGEDSDPQLWDTTARGEVDQSLATLTDAAVGVVPSPDGRLLATISSDNITRIWDLDPDRFTKTACAEEANRLTAAEWKAVLPDVAYNPPCS
ncbi:serine/threonine protein kinase [Frankia sp. AiPs1]|uniref:WD40 repeat domain-containing serine/threonine protein kinase n=1 Tax=Frankia sp. AiPs1 TaxID=573493 RepID=UPI002042D590|nr:serine/threonine-protein kinase [Frankia sp. AiPs1]MCM3923244.1 serine/threonine protein kinase [Frankia sp. AiPs1]